MKVSGRRAKFRRVYQYNQGVVRKHLPEGQNVFLMKSGGGYAMEPKSGAFVRVDKDRRSKKERQRARREARAHGSV